MRQPISHLAYLASDVFIIAFYKTFRKNVEYIQDKLGRYSKTKVGVIDPVGNPVSFKKTSVPVFLRNAGITAYMTIYYFDESEQLALTASFFFDKYDNVWTIVCRDDQKKQNIIEGVAWSKIEYFDWYLKRVKKFMESGKFDRRTFHNKMSTDFVRSKIKKNELDFQKKLEIFTIPN